MPASGFSLHGRSGRALVPLRGPPAWLRVMLARLPADRVRPSGVVLRHMVRRGHAAQLTRRQPGELCIHLRTGGLS
jgi:hypothetical protein